MGINKVFIDIWCKPKLAIHFSPVYIKSPVTNWWSHGNVKVKGEIVTVRTMMTYGRMEV